MFRRRTARLILALTACLAGLPAFADTQTVMVDLSFSEKAMAELMRQGEGVTLAAYWSGEPAPDATMQPDEMGMIFLQAEEVSILPAPGRFTFGANLAAAPLDQVVTPLLNLNVFSARWTNEDNILHCDLVDGELGKLTGAPQKLVCKLIVE